MKIVNRKTITFAVLAILTLTAGLALAQGPGQGRHSRGQGCGGWAEGPGARWEHLAERLELTAEQQTAIDELREANRAQNLELGKELARLQNELEGEMLKDDPDQKTALKLADRLGDLRKEMQASRLETRLAVREQLTPEQRDKMLAMGAGHGKRGGRQGCCDGHGPRRGGRHGRHGGGHGGWAGGADDRPDVD